jgi:ABC-type branched-subunit amino acid transport system ATPase component
MSASAILEVNALSIAFGGIKAVDDISFKVEPNKVTSLIGSNGAGKTTAFNLIAGNLKPDRGTVLYKGRRIDGLRPRDVSRLGIARSFQELRLFNRLSAKENILSAIPDQVGERLLAALFARGRVRKEAEHNERIVAEILDELAIAHQAETLAENLSYGQQKLVSLGRLLANRGEFLMLDEPTSGINPHLVSEFCERIRALVQRNKTIFLIEHNVDVVMAVSDHVIVMHQGKVIAQGTPVQVQQDKAVMHTYLGID